MGFKISVIVFEEGNLLEKPEDERRGKMMMKKTLFG